MEAPEDRDTVVPGLQVALLGPPVVEEETVAEPLMTILRLPSGVEVLTCFRYARTTNPDGPWCPLYGEPNLEELRLGTLVGVFPRVADEAVH